MIDVPISSVATQDAPSVDPTPPTVQAAQRLRDPSVPALVVCDDAGTVEGIVTESDIVALVAEGGGNRPLSSYMSTPVVTVGPSTPIGLAADRMRDAGICHLPVVDDTDSYLGLVTLAALAPDLPRYRLAVDWDSDPLSLEGTASTDASDALAME